jgi:hypothetical protein
MSELLLEQVSSFSGSFPIIETRSNFQVDENDSEPFFVTLPLGKAGNVSKNGRLYDREFYAELVRQVNSAPASDAITGIVGHSDPNGASWKVDMPALEWVGAALTEQNEAWGKLYVYPEETKLRSAIKRAMRLNGKVATSIWGTAEMEGNRAVRPTIKRIDYADPERAGVRAAIAVPIITKEMTGDKNVSDNLELITELRSDRDKARNDITALQTELAEMTVKYTNIEPKFRQIAELAGEKDAVQFVSELITERNNYRTEKLKLEIGQLISEQVKLEAARPLIATMLGMPESKAKAETALQELLKNKDVIKTMQALALMESGGHAYIGEHQDTEAFDEKKANQTANEIGYGF